MIEMMDMGRKDKTHVLSEASDSEPKIRYPTFSMVGGQIPKELGDMKNEEKCRLEIIVRKIGDTIDTYTEDEPRRVEVEIRKAGYAGEAAKATDGEFKDMTPDERKDYQKKEMEERGHEE